MPAATFPPPPAFVESILDDRMSVPPSHGDEGMSIERAAREAASHWHSRPSSAIEEVDHAEEFKYESVPLRIVGTALVEYQLGGRLEPSPFATDR